MKRRPRLTAGVVEGLEVLAMYAAADLEGTANEDGTYAGIAETDVEKALSWLRMTIQRERKRLAKKR